MKIGYMYPFKAHPPQGGNRLHAFQLTQGFLDRGHEVLTLGDDSSPDLGYFPRTNSGANSLLAEVDLLYIRIDANHLRKNPLVVNLMRRAAVPIVWEINAPANEALAFSWLGSHRRTHTLTARFADHLRRRLHALRQQPGIHLEERLRRQLARRLASAICVSEPIRDYAQKDLKIDRLKVLPNGSDPKVNHPGREPFPVPIRFQDHLKVLFAGSPIYPWQGLDVLTDAARASEKSGDLIVYLLLLNQPLECDLPSNMIVLQAVPYHDVARHICSADVCVALQPDFSWSRWGFHGSPMKLFDYMACGKPIVTSGVGQLGDVIRQHRNGLVCERNPGDLLDKLRFIASHPEDGQKMGERSRAAVLDRYNWASIVDETLTVFQNALSSGDS